MTTPRGIECARQFTRALKTILRIFRQRPENNCLHRFRDIGIELSWRRRRRGNMLHEHSRWRFTLKWHAPGNYLVHHYAE